MALTEFQRTLCRLIARQRIASGESYVAGGVALNSVAAGARVSRDIHLFHDTAEALAATWEADRQLLQTAGYTVEVVRSRDTFVEANIVKGVEGVVLQWVQDSAFRFFPLVEHPDFGLTLHPFDLATNKVLALVGRLEVRDWVDVITCHHRIQPLGYLAWAACGKDPGFTPQGILEQAGRSARYSAAEVASLSFAGPMPDAAELSRQWHTMLPGAQQLVEALPVAEVGKAVLNVSGELFTGVPAKEQLLFHEGRIRGAWPQLK